MKRLILLLCLIALPLLATTSTIIKLDIKGAIGPATSNYLKDSMISSNI